ncbi:hypothetical protein LTS18_000357 [Coniosporium uncinatum]|uniref:Uncharacterized protein n=1 Tax=Coniosporium uncinatum TaxID=93489 RepID=A0ACC3D8D6_9PEZI|nr:hypothetical protein LTS18_000357 [Coniosporium uncinatum]
MRRDTTLISPSLSNILSRTSSDKSAASINRPLSRTIHYSILDSTLPDCLSPNTAVIGRRDALNRYETCHAQLGHLFLDLEKYREQLDKLCEEAWLRKYRHRKMQNDFSWSTRVLEEAEQQIESVGNEKQRVKSKKADLMRNIAILMEERDEAAREYVKLGQCVGVWENEY